MILLVHCTKRYKQNMNSVDNSNNVLYSKTTNSVNTYWNVMHLQNKQSMNSVCDSWGTFY